MAVSLFPETDLCSALSYGDEDYRGFPPVGFRSRRAFMRLRVVDVSAVVVDQVEPAAVEQNGLDQRLLGRDRPPVETHQLRMGGQIVAKVEDRAPAK